MTIREFLSQLSAPLAVGAGAALRLKVADTVPGAGDRTSHRKMRYLALMLSRARSYLLALSLLSALALVFAQRPLTDLLPDTTVLAVELTPDQFDPGALHGLLAELDKTDAKAVWREYLSLFSSLADSSAFEANSHKHEFEEAREQFVDKCPALWDAAKEAGDGEWSAALGVSVSRFDPEPDLLFLTRTASRSVSARVLAGLITCFDGRRYGVEGGSAIYLFADGSDLPLLVAETNGVLVASSDPDVLRGAVRRSNRSGEPSLADSRIASYASQLEPAGVKVTLNLAAVADALAVVRGAVPPEAEALFTRFSNTLRILNGAAWAVSVDAGGFVVNSVSAWDAQLAEAEGEHALLAMLSCEECELPTSFFPVHTVAVEAGSFPMNAAVQWLDSWLADVAAVGMLGDHEALSVRSLFAELTGVDLDTAVFDWLGNSYRSYTTDVYGTDLTNWVMGLPSVTAIEVSSEEAAWRGVQAWLDIAANVDALSRDLTGSRDPFGGALGFEQSVSVRELCDEGVMYIRIRAAPNMDVGVAVINDHLVIGSPTSALFEAIDLGRIGQPVLDRAARLPDVAGVNQAAGANGRLVGYLVVSTPAFMDGFTRLVELAAPGVASGLWFAGVASAAYGDAAGAFMAPPSYDDALVLTDLFVDAVDLLSSKFGLAVGTASIRDDARWTTWRLPLNE